MKMNWPMFHRDLARRGVTPEKLLVPLKLEWVLQTEDRVFFASPTVSASVCYCGSMDRHLYAVRADTGELLWRFYTGDEGNLSNAVHDGLVFAGSNRDGCLRAIDSAKGELKWSYQTLGPVFATPMVIEDRVLIGSSDCNLYAIGVDSGKLIWKQACGGELRYASCLCGEAVFSGGGDGYLYANQLKDGRRLWRFKTQAAIHCTPAVDENMVFFGSDDHHLYAVDAEKGEKLWDFRTENSIRSTVAVTEQMVVRAVELLEAEHVDAVGATGLHARFHPVLEKIGFERTTCDWGKLFAISSIPECPATTILQDDLWYFTSGDGDHLFDQEA